MQRLKVLSLTISLVVLVTTMMPDDANSQSGRRRPDSSRRTPAGPPPPPAKVPETTAVVKTEQSGTTSRFVLANGMTVIINEQHATPLTAIVAYFKVGYSDEPDATRGIASLLERMMFKGTDARPAGRMASDTRALGAAFGADTWHDGAAYYIVSPAEEISEALAIHSDMIQNPSFPADELRREASALTTGELPKSSALFDTGEERALASTNPATYARARLYEVAFDQNRAGSSNATVAEGLRSITREQLFEFYKTHYRPENLIISVAGDVTTFNTLVEIERLYGEFGVEKKSEPATDKPAPGSGKVNPKRQGKGKSEATSPTIAAAQKPASEPVAPEKQQPPAGPRLRYGATRGDISQSIISVACQTPGMSAKEWPAIEVMASLLGQGRRSRLYTNLIDGQMIASRVEANYFPSAKDGLLTFQIWSDPNQIDGAESALFRELDRLRRETPSRGEMARAKTLLEKRFVDRTESYVGRAMALARAEAASEGYDAVLKYRDLIRAVSPQDVQRAAAKYFTPAGISVHEYEPRSAATRTFNSESFAATVNAWAPAFARPVDPKEVAAADEADLPFIEQNAERGSEELAALESLKPLAVRDFSTLNGPRAFVREDRTQPKVTIALLFQGGRLVEDATTSGATEMMLRMMLYGTARRASAQVHGELEQLGADVEIVTEPDFFGLTISVLSRNASRALKIVRDLIEEPAFREEDIARARIIQIGLIREERDSAAARSRALLNEALFPGHAYSLPPHGREEVISKLDEDKIRSWHEETVKRQFPLVVIVGDTDGSALVSGEISGGFRRRDTVDSIKVDLPKPSGPGEKAEQRGQQQTILYAGFPGPKGGSDDLIALDVIAAMMNGEGGRLASELRDKQSLIHSAAISSEAMFMVGTVHSQIVTSPENEQRARAGLLAEFERLARAGLSDEDMEIASITAAVAKTLMFESPVNHAFEYARAVFYKQDAAKVDAFEERFSKVTAAEIKRVAAQYLKSSAASFGVMRGTRPPSPPKQND